MACRSGAGALRAARGVLGASIGALASLHRPLADAQPVRSEALPLDPLQEGLEVCLVQVLHRHGARTALATPKWMPPPGSDEWSDLWGQCRQSSGGPRASVRADGGVSLTSDAGGGGTSLEAGKVTYGPCRRGDLTKVGEEQLERLGKYLRRRYLEGESGRRLKLTPSLSDGHLKVVSTRTSRTILSAACLLQGLFPQTSEADLQALIDIGDPAGEILYANHGRCDRLRQLFHMEASNVNAALQSVGTRMRVISELGPQSEAINESFCMIGDPLRSLRGHGRPLPAGFSEVLAKELDERGHTFVDATLGRGSAEIRRLSMGLLITEMTTQIKAAMAGESPLRLVVRSAHDVSIGGIMAALQLPAHHWPGFGSSIILEVLRAKASGKYFVHLMVHDGIPSAQSTIVDMFVPAEDWLHSVDSLMINEAEYEAECRLPPGTLVPPKQAW